jgi:hypothetical protein
MDSRKYVKGGSKSLKLTVYSSVTRTVFLIVVAEVDIQYEVHYSGIEILPMTIVDPACTVVYSVSMVFKVSYT